MRDSGDATRSDPVEDLLAGCLERPESEWEAAVDAACARSPEHAAALRERFARLRSVGFDAAGPFPERLGAYRLLDRLGGGGMGVVYLAADESLGREVALKLIRPEHLFFPGARERFRREVEATARLEHPGIVKVHAVGETDGIPYYAMERIRGLSLAELIDALRGRDPAKLGPADVGAAFAARDRLEPGTELPDAAELARRFGSSWAEVSLRLIGQAAVAIGHAHHRNVLHRDIKPSNMMVTLDGRLSLFDFGLATSEGTTRITQTGSTLGSLPYMAPEQLRGEAADESTDVYALGVSLYETLTLTQPFLEASQASTARRILEARCEPPRALYRGLDPDADTVCAAAMEPDRARRYATADALARDVTNVLELRPITARPVSTARRARRWIQRHPTISVAVALTFALLVFGPIALYLQERRHAGRLATTLADVNRLSDEILVSTLRDEERSLWPALPDRLPELDDWIARATTLLARLPEHRAALERLRAAALPYGDTEREADRATRAAIQHELDQHVAIHAELVERGGPGAATDPEIVYRERAIAEARARLRDRYTWTFDTTAERWRHTRLVHLLEELAELPGLVASVRERAEFAAQVVARSIEAHQDAWDRVIDEIAADPNYSGLHIRPQLGLVPLGRDPRSGLHEFAHLASGEVPERVAGELAITAASGIVLVLVPGGRVTLGAARGTDPDAPFVDPHADAQEGPPRIVQLDPFFIGKHEVSQAQWTRTAGSNPAELQPGFDPFGEGISLLHPVESVSWDDCAGIMRRLDLQLPTEAQWEHAARGGTTSPWWTGADVTRLFEVANLFDRSLERAIDEDGAEPYDDGHAVHAPIVAAHANPFGLHHVHGNVAEWCRDAMLDYDVFPPRPGDGLQELPGAVEGARRGGCWTSSAVDARITHREKHPRGNADSGAGVRACRRLDP